MEMPNRMRWQHQGKGWEGEWERHLRPRLPRVLCIPLSANAPPASMDLREIEVMIETKNLQKIPQDSTHEIIAC